MSKMTHGFFITINSMILYFKHIIHIDDFPLNGHPPSSLIIERRGSVVVSTSACHAGGRGSIPGPGTLLG